MILLRGRPMSAVTALTVLMMLLLTVAVPAHRAAAASIYCSSRQESRQVVELVHGFNSGPDTWGSAARGQIAAAGTATCIDVFDYAKYSTYWVTNPNIGAALATRIDTMAAASKAGDGSGKVIVLAHSMGGLATRCAAAASCNGGRSDVAGHLAELISFGTPNTGSWLAGPGLHDVGRTAGSLLSAACWMSFNRANPICREIQALGTSDATRAFKPDSTQLKSLPQLPATVPVYGLAAQVEIYSSFFGLNNVDVGDGGDLIVLEDSATAVARKVGVVGGQQIINCGRTDVTDVLRNAYSCWHSTETNDTRFLQAAAHQIALFETNNAPATLITKIAPVTIDGTVVSGWTVSPSNDADPLMCDSYGSVYPSPESLDDNVYYCSPTAASADACWPAASGDQVYCLTDPFASTLLEHPISGPLPPVAKERKYLTPIGITLADGLVCRARNGGSWSGLQGHTGWAGWFFCGRGDPYKSSGSSDQVVWAPSGSTSGIDEKSKTWTVFVGNSDGTGPVTKVSVTKATFVGYP